MDTDTKQAFENINTQFTQLQTFIMQNMALKSDVDEVKTELAEVKEGVRVLQTSVDGLAKQVLTFQQEMAIMSMRVSRMDAWIQAASQKIGIPYPV